MVSASDRKPKIRIAVVGHDPLRLVGLRAILESEPGFIVQALSLSNLNHEVEADVVLLAVRGTHSLYNAITSLRGATPGAKIILTGAPPGEESMIRAIAAGVKGYLDEAAAPEQYKEAIRVVAGGSIWAPRKALAILIDRMISKRRRSTMAQPAGLSERERQVLELLVAGRTNKEIGAELGIEERTVKSHITKLMQKAGVNNRIALSVHAVNNILLSDG
jgi:DNA-binding NarL/FixJ family response regulator